jgi:hypothetical protein
VPNDIIYSGKRLTPGEFRLWVTIRSHCKKHPEGGYEGCWPGRRRLALILGISDVQVSNLVSRLKGKGLLEVKARGQGRTSLYYLQDPPSAWKQILEMAIAQEKANKKEELMKAWRAGRKKAV